MQYGFIIKVMKKMRKKCVKRLQKSQKMAIFAIVLF